MHLSTQLNVANVDALKFYSQFADVVVLARELNMEQVAIISCLGNRSEEHTLNSSHRSLSRMPSSA